jgi:hypothetical protein
MGAKKPINVTFSWQIKLSTGCCYTIFFIYFVQAESPLPLPKNPAELEAFIVLMERRNCIFTVPALLDSVANEY